MIASVTGARATATARVGEIGLTLTSLYGLMEPNNSYSAMNRHLADIAPLLDAPDHLRQNIVGGDFNLTSQWSGAEADYAPLDRAILDQFRGWGLRDVLAESATGRLAGCTCSDAECRHVQTYFPTPPLTTPRQNDYMFVAKRLKGHISARVDPVPVSEGLSDHAPLVLTIET